jgi:hypothetical protein
MQRPFRLSMRAPGVDQAFGCCLVRMVIRLITYGQVAGKWSVCHRAEGFAACGTRAPSDSPFKQRSSTKNNSDRPAASCSVSYAAYCSLQSAVFVTQRSATSVPGWNVSLRTSLLDSCVRDLLLHSDDSAVRQTTHGRFLSHQLQVIIHHLIVRRQRNWIF